MISCFRPPKKHRKQSIPQNRTKWFGKDEEPFNNYIVQLPPKPKSWLCHLWQLQSSDNWQRPFLFTVEEICCRICSATLEGFQTPHDSRSPSGSGRDSSGSFILCNVSNTSVWHKCWKQKCQDGANTAGHPFILSSERLLFFRFSPITDQI